MKSSQNWIFSLCLLLPVVSQAEAFQAPKSLADPVVTGACLPRTFQLLRTSTAEKPNTIRILFYGQSITEQSWTKEVIANLKTKFAAANIVSENRSIGGHSSQILVKTAEADLYPFYPDLVIFHVYGDHLKYEDIIRNIRERTTAEVLMQTDHLNAADKVDEPTDPVGLTPAKWNQWMNYVQLPAIAKKYGAELVDQRNLWKKYLNDCQLQPQALLKDSVHLNEDGNHLMAAIVTSVFDGKAGPSETSWKSLVTTQSVTSGETIRVEFEGNRLDADQPALGAQITIDGKMPAQFQSCWTFTKSSGYNGTNWPCLLRVQKGAAALQEEDWEVTIQDSNDDYTNFKFAIKGSETGDDGDGSAKEKFTSKSGRIVIEPEDWNLVFSQKVFKKKLAPEFVIKFRSQLQKAEPTVLVQGLPNGKHIAEIKGLPTLKNVTIFKPPFPIK